MASGYSEPDYDVSERAQSQSASGTTHYEIRVVREDKERQAFFDSLPEYIKARTVKSELKRYIAIFGAANQQPQSIDHLLLYDGNDDELDADWARLIAPQVVALKDLRWTEHVEGHFWGNNRKDGTIRMY
jgi:nitric oxide synthase oxygenase domain/subunit